MGVVFKGTWQNLLAKEDRLIKVDVYFGHNTYFMQHQPANYKIGANVITNW